MLVVASGALIATSPSAIQSFLNATYSGAAELTPVAPRVTGRVLLELSAAALPAARDSSRRVSGTVVFRQSVEDAGVRMGVQPVGIDPPPAEDVGSVWWPIEQLCRVAEPCQREFEVTLEWVAPQPGTVRRSDFTARAEITFEGVETNPAGASGSWRQTADFAPAPGAPVLSAGSVPERVTLDRAHPAAARHVVLRASDLAQSTQTAVFVRSSVTPSGEEGARITLVPDDPADGGRTPADVPINPFGRCPARGDCERGISVLIELAVEPDTKVVVEWSLRAQAEFSIAGGIPDGAELSAVVDGSVDVGPETPAVTASASGTLETDSNMTGSVRSTTRIAITADGATLRRDGYAALPAPAVGVLTVRAADDVWVYVVVQHAGGSPDVLQGLKLGPSETSATVLVYPLRSCDGLGACTAEVTLSVSVNATPAATAGDRVVTVVWDLDLTVFYPGLSRPPDGARVRIDVHADDR